MIRRFALGFALGVTAVLLRRAHRPAAARSGNALTDEPRTRRLVGIIAHELRTPTAIILGYEELLAEGLLGPLDPRSRDALDRMRRATNQLRDLTDGLHILTGEIAERNPGPNGNTAVASLARDLLDQVRPEAEARGVRLDFHARHDPTTRVDAEALGRVLDLLFTSSIRVAAGRTVTVEISGSHHVCTTEIRGLSLDPERDTPPLEQPPGPPDSGIGLRLAIARRIAHSLDADIDHDRDSLRLRVPIRA